MHYYIMNILEETESEHQSELKLWLNDKDKIYLEVGPVDNEDPHHMGFITLTKDDARALSKELNRLLNTMQEDESPQVGKQLYIQKVNWGQIKSNNEH
jgi:hypothetical protein